MSDNPGVDTSVRSGEKIAEPGTDIIARAMDLLERDTVAAECLMEEVVGREPDKHEARIALFNARLRRSDFAGALAVMDEALALRPEAPDLLTLRATVRTNLGRLEEAAESPRPRAPVLGGG